MLNTILLKFNNYLLQHHLNFWDIPLYGSSVGLGVVSILDWVKAILPLIFAFLGSLILRTFAHRKEEKRKNKELETKLDQQREKHTQELAQDKQSHEQELRMKEEKHNAQLKLLTLKLKDAKS